MIDNNDKVFNPYNIGVWNTPIENQVFEAILSSNNVREAAKKVPMEAKDMMPYLVQIGVIHPKGELWKKSVQDFLDAGKPIQLSLF